MFTLHLTSFSRNVKSVNVASLGIVENFRRWSAHLNLPHKNSVQFDCKLKSSLPPSMRALLVDDDEMIGRGPVEAVNDVDIMLD